MILGFHFNRISWTLLEKACSWIWGWLSQSLVLGGSTFTRYTSTLQQRSFLHVEFETQIHTHASIHTYACMHVHAHTYTQIIHYHAHAQQWCYELTFSVNSIFIKGDCFVNQGKLIKSNCKRDSYTTVLLILQDLPKWSTSVLLATDYARECLWSQQACDLFHRRSETFALNAE